jgi:ATP-binding cassette subfamily C (CFTR/MRP) protein 1
MCCLKDDLKMFPNGVDTKLGENGASLSGGQMARVSLARAIYQRPDIYLLDDPLSALDATVGAQIFTNVIQNRPAEKTILLATHQLHYMSKMDKIIVVEEGVVAEYGTFAELIAQDGVFGKMMERYSHEETEAKKSAETTKEIEQTDEDKDDDIVKKETSSEGRVKLEIYKKYFRSMGVGVSYSFIAVFLIGTALKTSVDFWLMKGTQDPNLSTSTFILFYSILAGTSAICNIFTFWWVARATLAAAEKLHAQALAGIFAAPISFFESNPTGRILNRFTADTESVDIGSINVALGMMRSLLIVVASLILVAQASWILLRIDI